MRREILLIERFAIVLFVAALFAGCASSGRTISRIHLGQNIEEVRKSIGPITENFFEVLDEGSLHNYIQARHPKSGVLFGLYYENGKLSSLIVDQDVTEFHIYRLSKLGEPHWLSRGFAPYRAWLMERNRLDSGVPDPGQTKKELAKSKPPKGSDMTAEEVATIVPITLFAGWMAMFYVTDKVFGIDPDTRANKEKQQREKAKREALHSLQIGTSKDRLIEVMESWGKRVHINRPNIYTYLINSTDSVITIFRPSYSFGVLDGKVVWLESCSMLTGSKPPVSQAFSGTYCGVLKGTE